MEGDSNLFIKEKSTEYFITVTARRFHVTIKRSQVIQWVWELVFWLSLLALGMSAMILLTSPRGMEEVLTFRRFNMTIPLRSWMFMGGATLLLSLLAKLWYHDEEIEVTPWGIETLHYFFKVRPFKTFKEDAITQLELITTPSACTVMAKNENQHLIASLPVSHSLHLSSMIRRCWHP